MTTCCPCSMNATTKRKRRRKPWSKKKPKIPAPNYMPHLLKIHAGGDVVETITAFARAARIFGVCVLSASGPIAGAVLWEASPYPSTRTVQGSFYLRSFTATFPPGGRDGSLTVTLAEPHGQIVSGVLAGPLVAAGTVTVLAATFASSVFHRFGAVNNTSASMFPAVGGDEGCGKSTAAEKCEAEKSDRDMLKKRSEELDQFLDLPPEVDCVFIGDGASVEKTGLDGGGEEVDQDGNMFENYLKGLEHYLEVPAYVGDAFNCVGEGDCFQIEEYVDLQIMFEDAFWRQP